MPPLFAIFFFSAADAFDADAFSALPPVVAAIAD